MTIQAALLHHYDRHGRDLPWRADSDPYRVWVSEVMLQQTRVETVIPYYKRWLELFPDVDRLAAADLDDVLLAWQGLGYYRRARNLHTGAAVVRERHGSSLPGGYEELRALPGVGEYTAGAVASIAFGEVVPAVDGNVKRVLSRLYDEPAPTPAWLRRTAGELVDRERPGDWNQALMELGATVCTPTTPGCHACPVAEWCRALAAGTVGERPARSARREVPARSFAVAVVVDGAGRALVARRPDDGLLPGMWAFPDMEMEGMGARAQGGTPDTGAAAGGGRAAAAHAAAHAAAAQAAAADPAAHALDAVSHAAAAHVVAQALDAVGHARSAAEALDGVTLHVGPGAWPQVLPHVRHRFTHLDATYLPVLLAGEGADTENRRWIPLTEPSPVALPVAQQKIARSAAAALLVHGATNAPTTHE